MEKRANYVGGTRERIVTEFLARMRPPRPATIATHCCLRALRYSSPVFWKEVEAKQYSVFDSADTCFTIAYSCIMLNTLLHNPNVKDRPTLERYQSMNKLTISTSSYTM
ncbi:Sec7 domain protein [Cooperia oncophora]